MNNKTEELIKFLNDLKSNQEDANKIAKICIIVNFRNTMDIKNGEPYLNEIIKDQKIQKHIKYRQPQYNFNFEGQPISPAESFIQNCNAVIVAISKAILEEKVKDEFKNQA